MKKAYDDKYKYEIFNDGYDIYENDSLLISQRGPCGKPINNGATYEENCLLQLNKMAEESNSGQQMSDKERIEMLEETINEILTVVIPSLVIQGSVHEIVEVQPEPKPEPEPEPEPEIGWGEVVDGEYQDVTEEDKPVGTEEVPDEVLAQENTESLEELTILAEESTECITEDTNVIVGESAETECSTDTIEGTDISTGESTMDEPIQDEQDTTDNNVQESEMDVVTETIDTPAESEVVE